MSNAFFIALCTKSKLNSLKLPILPKTFAFKGILYFFLKLTLSSSKLKLFWFTICGTYGIVPPEQCSDNHLETNAYLSPCLLVGGCGNTACIRFFAVDERNPLGSPERIE